MFPEFTAGRDEMVSGDGRIRPHWRGVMEAVHALGQPALAERGERLSRAMQEEGPASVLPGARGGWRLDPLPLPLAGAEFEALSRGVAQRARLLEAVLSDLYGRQELLSEGLLPAPLVLGSPDFMRPMRGAAAHPWLSLYAADLVRGADGAWRVLQDRTGRASGLGQALENRRMLSYAMPEAFRTAAPLSLSPFFELWQESLARLAPGGRAEPATALLSPGIGDPHWYEHVVLSRELSCALVEAGDLSVRNGKLFLKTLAGLRRLDVLLSRLDAHAVDPLDQPEADAGRGVPGLLDALRHGALACVNRPGSALGEMPGLAAFLDGLAPRIIGTALELRSLPTVLLGPGEPPPRLPEGAAAWLFRAAEDGRAAERRHRDPTRREAAIALPALPMAPSAEDGLLTPAPLILRVFAMRDGGRWHCLPGGLARLVGPGAPLTGRLPGAGWCKDVWVPPDPSEAIIGPAAHVAPPLPIRRNAGVIPSRVADNLFWLGRYVERLDRGARLMRASIARIRLGGLLPREMVELSVLAHCLNEAALVGREARPSTGSLSPLADALGRQAAPAMRHLQDRIGQLVESVRDRLTADMHATFTQTLHAAADALDAEPPDLPELERALLASLRFANAVAGMAAENMVRGGAHLFLELGRRIERGQAVASEIATALDGPPQRIEAGLRLVLELCDSAITYRSRYLNVLQPAPALDLVLADPSNPRGLAFQLAGVASALGEVSAERDDMAAQEAGRLLALVQGITPRLLDAADQAREAAELPPLLRHIAGEIGVLSDMVTRRYFALLPAPHAVGVDTGGDALVLGA